MQQHDKVKDPNSFLFAETSSEDDGDGSNRSASVIEADWQTLQQQKRNSQMKERPGLAALAAYSHQVDKYFKDKGALQYQSSPVVPPQAGLFAPSLFSALPPMQVRGHSSQGVGPQTNGDASVAGGGAGTTAVNVFNAIPEGAPLTPSQKKKKKKKVKKEEETVGPSVPPEAPTELRPTTTTSVVENDNGEDAPPGLRHVNTTIYYAQDSNRTKPFQHVSHSATLPMPNAAERPFHSLTNSLSEVCTSAQLNKSRETSATTTTTTISSTAQQQQQQEQQQQQQEQLAWDVGGGGVPALRSHLYYEQENGVLVDYVQHGRRQAQREELHQQQEAAEAKRELDRRRWEQLFGTRGFGERPGARERTVSAAALRRWSSRDDAAGYRPFLVQVLRYLHRVNLFLNAFACGAAVFVLILVTISNSEQTDNMMVVTLRNTSSVNVGYNSEAAATLGGADSSVTSMIIWSNPTRLALLSTLMSLFDPAFFIILSLLLVVTTLVPVACGFADRQWRDVRRGQWSTLLSGTAADEEGGEAAVAGRGAGSATTLLDLRMNEVNQHVNEAMAAQHVQRASVPTATKPHALDQGRAPPPPPPPLGALTATETNARPPGGSKVGVRPWKNGKQYKKANLYRSTDYQLDAATTAQLTTAAFLQDQKRRSIEEEEQSANKENINNALANSAYFRPGRSMGNVGDVSAEPPPYNMMERSASYGRGTLHGSGSTSPKQRPTLASSGTLFGSRGLFGGGCDDEQRYDLSTLNSASNAGDPFRRHYLSSNVGAASYLGNSGTYYGRHRGGSHAGEALKEEEGGASRRRGGPRGSPGTTYSLTKSISEGADLEANNLFTRVSFAVENWMARHCLFLLCCVGPRSQRLAAVQHAGEPVAVQSKKDRSVLHQYYYNYYVEVEGLYLLFQPRLWCLIIVLALSVAELSVLDQKENLDLLLSLEMNSGPLYNFSFDSATSSRGSGGTISGIDLSQSSQASYKTTDGKLLLGVFATRATLLILSWLFDLFF